MPTTTIKQWAEGHGTPAVSRVAKRLARFANNSTDPDTSLAAGELVSMIEEAMPKGKANDESAK